MYRRSAARPASQFLMAFAVALVVPMLAMSVLVGWNYVTSERNASVERAEAIAKELAVAVERELAPSQVALQILATAPSLKNGDLGAFYERAKEAADGLHVIIALRKPNDGVQLLNTSRPFGTELEGDDPVAVTAQAEAIKGRRMVITGLLSGNRVQQPAMIMLLPVFNVERPQYVLSIQLLPRQFAQMLTQIALPRGWVSGVIDQEGRVIARSVDQDRFVSRKVPADWFQSTKGSSKSWTGANLDGQTVLVAHAISSMTGWTTAVSVTADVLHAPLWRTLSLVVAVGATLLLIGVLLAAWAGSRIASAISKLEVAASDYVVTGNIRDVATPVAEINSVGKVMRETFSRVDEREAYLRSILETVPSALMVLEGNGTIRTFSSSAERLFGCLRSDAVGKKVGSFVPELQNAAEHGQLDDFISTDGGKVNAGRMLLGTKADGGKMPLEVHVGKALIDGAQLYTVFLRDQTEKQRVELELRQTQKMEAVGKLTGGVAHDFNNLLTVIVGNLEMLEKHVSKDKQSLLREAQEAADLAAQLTSGLLAFGRRMPLNPQQIDLADFIGATIELLRRTLGETIEVITAIKKVSDVVLDGNQLQNAILNLAINARDAMPGGGKLSISISDAVLDEDYAKTYGDVAPGDYVMVMIADSGHGMSSEVLAKAFEPFFTTKPQGAGTGLGLSSVYGFVKQSGGHLAIYSEAGRGTVVRMYFPAVAGGRTLVSRAADGSRVPKGSGQLVLVVEDDERVRRVTVSRLNALGYTVVEAENGSQALGIIHDRPDIQLLFTDMIMPGGMDGAELARLARIRRPDIKIAYTSGYAEPATVREASAATDAWLRKPYTATELAEMLHKVFQG